MLSVEMYFQDTIARYNDFKLAANQLIEEVHNLPPEQILQRCQNLRELQEQLTENKEYLFVLMEFVGPGILDTAMIGEFQRALDKAIESCDTLYSEVLLFKHNLQQQLD